MTDHEQEGDGESHEGDAKGQGDRTGRDALDRLTPQQIIARDALLRGATVTEAAEEAGVDRTTASRWKNQNPDFRASLNRGKREQERVLRSMRLRVKKKALEQLEDAVEEGNHEAIKLTVTAVKAEPDTSAGSTDPAAIAARDQIVRAVREEAFRTWYAQTVALRIAGGRKRKELCDRLRELADQAEGEDRARTFNLAAQLLNDTTEEMPFDDLAPEVVAEWMERVRGSSDGNAPADSPSPRTPRSRGPRPGRH